MRLAGLRSMLFGAVALLLVGSLPGCENPFDPLDKSDKIEGLSYVEFSATWDRWDSDPEYDGLSIELSYYNEYGDTLDFHDKPHNVTIEFWTQVDIGTETQSYLAQGQLLYSKTIRFEDSDDIIRIPVEAYKDAISSIIDATSGEASGFMVLHVFPPEQSSEITVAEPDTLFFKPEVAEDTPNG